MVFVIMYFTSGAYKNNYGGFDVMDVIIDTYYELDSSVIIVLTNIRRLVLIVMHAVAIMGKTCYPKNKSMNRVFKIDMAILAITIIIVLIVLFQAVAFCITCQEDCG